MKKYILLLLFLTAIVVGPFAYQRWSEAKRLRHIRETKQYAAQIRATPLKDFLQQLDQTSPDQTVLVLFTGNTQAHLEPCGCFIGQSGGLPKLSAANPDVHWLVIHPSLEQYFSTSEAVSVFSIRNFQDKEASPFVFNALDMAVFPAVLGASSPYLLELAACRIPLIVWGYNEPSEVAGACRFFHVEPSPFDSLHPPIASISEAVQELAENPGERKKLGMKAREIAVSYTWDATVRQLLNCISDCQKKRVVNHTPTNPLLFTKHYNRAQGRLKFQARDLLDGSLIYEIEKAIAMTLSDRHTHKEMEALLLHLCQDAERVKRILAGLDET